ncbi:MAG: U32 family peptidase, partial [Eggerthellaceae bacterium]|nr:U32 family peptidase [Eggerthellaceae bacterium]
RASQTDPADSAASSSPDQAGPAAPSDPRDLAALSHPVTFAAKKPYLTASVVTQEQYDACRQGGIDVVYFRNVVPRNSADYQAFDKNGEGERSDASADEHPGMGDGSYRRSAADAEDLLVGGMGGVRYFRDRRSFVTDYSLNVVNAKSCRELHRLGAKRVTLSYEINEWQLREMLEAYRAENGGSPALEMIVYGHAPLLVTKYCPLKKMGQCGRCRTTRYEIRDEYGSFPILPLRNCDTVVLNGKRLNLLDEMSGIEGVEAFRLNFALESAEEVMRVIAQARGKLDGSFAESVFDPQIDTRGYFNKEIL